MKYYKDNNNEVFGFDDDFDGVPEELNSITEDEMKLLTKVELTPEQILSQQKANGKDYDLNGTIYKVPFTSEDANGLMQVNVAFTMGIADTNIHFSNGTVMPIVAADFQAFALWFVTKRNSFFL